MRNATPLLVFACVMAIAACAPSGPLNVKTVQLGRSLNSDDSVGSFVTRFKPEDTVYAAVLTDNAGSGTLKASWTFRGRSISEEEKKVSYREPAATEFHLRYAGGLPPGAYKVEIRLDGTPVASRDFVVEP
jgi:hypothetical protein